MQKYKYGIFFKTPSSFIMAVVIMVGAFGCSDHDKSTWSNPPTYTVFKGLVSLSVVDILGRPFPGIPVVMEVRNSVDPMAVPFDTVYTNEYGLAFLDVNVTSLRNADAGHIVIDIDGTRKAIDKYFVNGEQFYLIYRIFRDRDS